MRVISYFKDVKKITNFFSLKSELCFHVVQHISREIGRSISIISHGRKAVYGKAEMFISCSL